MTELPAITKRQAAILRRLRDQRNIRAWVTEAELKTMYFLGLTDGAGRQDDKGTGNYPETRLARITKKGEQALEAFEALHARGTANASA